MGQRQGREVVVQQADGTLLKVDIAPKDDKVEITKPDGTKTEGTVVQVPTPTGPQTVILPADKILYSVDMNKLVVLSTDKGVITGVKTYYLCAAEEPTTRNWFGREVKGKGYIAGYTDDPLSGKCNVVFNGKPHSAEKSKVIQDDGSYAWTTTPVNGATFGAYGGIARPICRTNVDGMMLSGNVMDGKCVVANGRNIHTSQNFEYLDHPLNIV
jgi:hypothetical protein